MTNQDPITLTQKLIKFQSITPNDDGCLEYISSLLQESNFSCNIFSKNGVKNLFARWKPSKQHKKTLAFNGHVDVVPPGHPKQWKKEPFSGEIENCRIYGRGAVDMKSAIAAFVIAAKEAILEYDLKNSIVLMLTSDEEGEAKYGTKELLKWAHEKKEIIDDCIVGEPTSLRVVGDTIKLGRRGSLNGTVLSTGKQGHIAYPKKAINPVEKMVDFLSKLKSLELDSGNSYFDPSSLNISAIETNNPSSNVIPGECTAFFNIRYNDNHSAISLKELIDELAKEFNNLRFGKIKLLYRDSGDSFITEPGHLSETMSNSIKKITGLVPTFSTGGGTSDARFIQKFYPVIEFGLVGNTMHQADENTRTADIVLLKNIYKEFIKNYVL
jgi:succinyl-diaminopimelate desuccinylase